MEPFTLLAIAYLLAVSGVLAGAFALARAVVRAKRRFTRTH